MTLAALSDLPPIVAAVRRFVEEEVGPAASALEHADHYPHALVARMRDLGLFGCLVPERWGGLGLAVSTYARVVEELCRGWMSLAGVINSHTMAALIVLQHGTEAQRDRFLPRFARGEARGGLCLTEPHAGSDVAAIRTAARRQGDHYLVSGTKMFITNGREGNAFALLALTDPGAHPRHRGMSCFIVEKGHPGFQVVKAIGKLGYKGVDTVELTLDQVPVPAANLVGGVEGRGFYHVMSGLETGRINIAARAVGVAQAALDEARGAPEATRRPDLLARMAARVEAARLLTSWAGAMKDRSERCDLEAGMAKLYASEAAQEVAADAIRLLGPRSQWQSGTLERHYRDTPLMIIGEGANEIQRTLIARQLVERYGERAGALTARDGEPPERRQAVLAVRQVVDKDLAPLAQAHDGRGEVPAAVLARLAELGVLGATLPARAGGLDLDLTTAAMIVEEVARGWGAVGWLLGQHLAASRWLCRHGPAAGGDDLLARLARGEALATAGQPVERVATGSEGPQPVLAFRLPGTPVVLLAPAPGGRMLVVQGDVPGVAVEPAPPGLGLRGLEEVRMRPERREVAAPGAGPEAAAGPPALAEVALALSRLGAAACAVGLAQAGFEAALRYSQQRSTFGKPICQHQAIQLKLADMASRTAAARLLTYRAAARLDEAGPEGAGAGHLALGEAAETAAWVTLESMRVHGGYGYTTEFPVERYYRDAAAVLAWASASPS